MTRALLAGLEAHFHVDFTRLPEHIAERFVALGPDERTEQFLSEAERRRVGAFATRLHGWLGRFMSDFDVNGLLDVYPMHLLGTEQFRRLLGVDANGPRFRSLLDVGAGSGDVTLALLPLFEQVTAFETSSVMRWRLRRRGVACTEHDLTAEPTSRGPFDVVACLNVLDRCRSPGRLLDHALGALVDGGRLLIALALPYAPFFYERGRSVDPDAPLELSRSEWEAALTDLLRQELEPRGLSLLAWTRAPYLSGGDARRPLYVLDDAVLVLERV